MPLVADDDGTVRHEGAQVVVKVPTRRQVRDAFQRVREAIDRGLLPAEDDWKILQQFVLLRS